MTLKDFWELNIRGNAAEQLKKLTVAGNKAASSFQKTQNMSKRFSGTVRQGATSISQLEARLAHLTRRQREAFDPKRIALYNRMIQRTQAEVTRLNGLSARSRFGGMGSMLGGAGSMLKGAARMALPLGVAGLAFMGGRHALNTSMNFGQEMSRVQAITGARGSELAALRDSAINVGGATPFTATEAASGLRYLGMAGFNSKESRMALPATTNLAMAGDVGLDRSADVLSNVMGQYQMEAFRAAEVSNVMAATISTSNTNFEQMSEAMKYLGPTFHSMNMTLEETASVVAALGDAGIQGSLAGRALGTSLVRLANPTKKMQESIDQLGLRVFDARGKFVGMKDMLRQLEQGTKNLTEQQKAAHIQTIFGSEAYQEMTILLNKGSDAFGQYTESITGTTKAAEMAATMQDNLAGDVKKLNSAWEKLILTIDNGQGSISTFFRSVTNFLTQTVDQTSVREKFDLGHVFFTTSGKKDADSLAETYLKMDRKMYDLSARGGSGEDQMAAMKAFQAEVYKEFSALKLTHDDMKGAKIKMVSDLVQRAQDNIRAVQDLSGKAVKPAGSDSTVSTPGIDQAAEEISGGGKHVRNVIVNIKALNEGGINNHVATAEEAVKLSEDKLMEMLVRAVRGSEQVLIQGEG